MKTNKTDQQLFEENQCFYLAYKNKYLKVKLDLKRKPNPEFEKRLDEFWSKIEDIFKEYGN
jgi:hypothetical protein